MRNTIIAIVICFSLLCSQANAATASPIDTAWNKGLAWMMRQQHSDGGWSDASGLGVQTTAEFLNALWSANLRGSYTFLGGLSWLGNATAASVDALSRQIGALATAGGDTSSLTTKLLAWRNLWSAWGAYPQYETSLPDTPLAIISLMDAKKSSYSDTDLKNAACQFLPTQLSSSDNYLWPYSASGATGSVLPSGQRSGAIVPTAYAILALQKISAERSAMASLSCNSKSYALATVIDHAVTGLLTKKKSDNGFGDGNVSTVVETALVYRVLKTIRPNDPATGPALDYLLNKQQAVNNGSWEDSAYSTAVVLASLPAPSALVDSDRDGIPDGVEAILGTDPNNADDARSLAKDAVQKITPTHNTDSQSGQTTP